MAVEVDIELSPSWDRTARALRKAKAADAIEDAARDRIPAVLRPLVDDLQREAKSVRITSAGGRPARRTAPPRSSRTAPARGRGAREAVADAIDILPGPGGMSFSVRVDYSRLPSERRGLPTLFNGRAWDHPVYGNKRVQVRQSSNPEWWRATVQRHVDNIRAEGPRILEEAWDRLL